MTEWRSRRSIRRRLLAALLGAILLAWGAALWFSYRDTRHELDELLDAHLAQSASLLIAQLGGEVGEIDTEHVARLHRYERKVAFQVWDRNGRLRLRSAGAPQAPLSAGREGFSDSLIDGRSWRVFSAADETRHVFIQVGEQRKARDELSETVAENLLRPMLVTLPVLGLLIWFGVARGLRPLTTLGRELAQRRADDLAPLDAAAVPNEVLPLVTGLNQLFARLRASLDKERRFTADAAHELRTPLAAIMAQAQVARAAAGDEERRRALDNVLAGCARAAHLMEQLLTLARLEPGQFHPDAQPCALRALAAAVIAELAPAAVHKRIELQLVEGPEVRAPGAAALLSILMRNLVDNAIRYSPPGGAVRVAVAPTAAGAELSVTDQGPGIPPEARELVWERFYRVLGTEESGSGLGLSIVRRIAELHHARLNLGAGDGGKGLRVTVLFPA